METLVILVLHSLTIKYYKKSIVQSFEYIKLM